jgi:hypothetical protein
MGCATKSTQRATLGERFSIALPLHCGTGVRWHLVGLAEVTQLSSKDSCAKTAMGPGGNGYQVFVLIPVATGHFTLKWYLQRPGERPFEADCIDVHVD